MASSRRVTGKKIPVQISMDEAPTPFTGSSWAFVYFLLISSFSRLVTCVAFQSFSFCVLSFQNRLDLIRDPAFYWVFYFPNLSLFVSSYVKMKKFCSF